MNESLIDFASDDSNGDQFQALEWDDKSFDELSIGEILVFQFPSHLGEGQQTIANIENGLYVSAVDVVPAQPLTIKMHGSDHIRFRSWLSHGYSLQLDALRHEHVLGPHCEVAAIPVGSIQNYQVEPAKRARWVTVVCSASKLKETIGSHPILSHSSPVSLAITDCAIHGTPIDSKIRAAAEDILNPPYGGEIGRQLTKARSLEVLYRLIQTLPNEIGKWKSQSSYNALTIDKLNFARDILDGNVSEVPNIAKLSDITDLGRTKLVKGFREMFGESIGAYVLRRRMEIAQELLRAREMPVNMVAHHVGYEHQSTFSAAYRKYFGHAPSDARI